MSSVLCFGELLLRFSPALSGEWIKENQMPVYVGGAELNVAIGLAHLGEGVSYFSAVPDNYLSREVVDWLKGKNIDTGKMLFAGDRIGTYYLPQGTDLKGAGVIYDRAHSSFWNLKPSQVDWDMLFSNVRWLHFSAICPALNQNVADLCLEAVRVASEKGITVSIDMNYRAKLWQYGKQPHEIMPAIAAYADIIMGNIWAEEAMLGIRLPEKFDRSKKGCAAQSLKSSIAISERFPRCKLVANTFRFSEDAKVDYYATIFLDGEQYISATHTTENVVDRVGTGDTFMAALIYGSINSFSGQRLVDFATAAAFNKFFLKGDASTATAADIINTYSI